MITFHFKIFVHIESRKDNRYADKYSSKKYTKNAKLWIDNISFHFKAVPEPTKRVRSPLDLIIVMITLS